MAFLDKLSNVAKSIGDLAGEAVETTKLNSKISSAKNAIDGVNKKIGEFYYDQYLAGAILPEEISEFFVEIDGYNATIEEAKAEIERIKSENAPDTATSAGVTCVCGKENAPGTKFCQECGAKLEAFDKRICICGAEIAPDVRFCGECGAKFE